MYYIKTECLWFCVYVNGIYMTSSIKTNPVRMVRARSHCVLNLYLITRYFCAYDYKIRSIFAMKIVQLM